jgi:aminoglycoside/choline kinase family phosphotransferase
MDNKIRVIKGLSNRLFLMILSIKTASDDASFRRYFRVFTGNGKTYITMDAPPEKEQIDDFIKIAKFFKMVLSILQKYILKI